jgi:ATP-dependent Clp protease ATP-binding subunit ClpE
MTITCPKCNEETNEMVSIFIKLNEEDQNPKEISMCRKCSENGNVLEQLGLTDLLEGAGMNMSSTGKSISDIFSAILGGHNQSNQQSTNGSTKTETKKSKRNGILDSIGRNLNDLANDGKIQHVIGREKEIDQVIEIINRKNKNNPVLIGESGVGKTAIAEGLALRIVNENVPEKLLNKEIYSIDAADIVMGTGIRGQLEAKLKALFAELEERPEVLLFIDEIHQLVGAGSGEGAMDVGNILKPALSRGQIQVMGATTLKEYRMIEKDPALERRFQPVTVLEPSMEDSVEILKGIRSSYEQHHDVILSDEVLQACVTLSHRYMQDRRLPDKAIDLLDIAGSKVNLRQDRKPMREIVAQIEEVRAEKEQMVLEQNFETAADLRDKEVQLEASYEALRPSVQVEDIEVIVEEKTGIPVRKLQEKERTKMKNLSETLGANVIGQSSAVEKVAKSIRRARAGLKDPQRPIASFLFVGPTGVGKTELTKQLALELFGSKDAMIRLDMSEYMEKHSVSKLIGSPPGYVGHDEAGQLTEQVRRKPYSIILLDEIEKGHPDVQNMFLQILEDGRLTDSHGKTVSFKDTVIIATSNAGITDIKPKTLGFNQAESTSLQESSLIDSLKPYFRPEFLNRFDGIVEFKHLEEESLVQIVDLLLSDLDSKLKAQNISLDVTEPAKKQLTKLGYDKQFGARPLRRTIQQYIEDKATDLILDEEGVTTIKVRLSQEEIIVEKA